MVLVLVLLAPAVLAATQGGPIPVPLPLFPPNNWWNVDVSNAPVDPNSANFITFIGSNVGMHPDFGGDAGGGFIYGIPFILVDGSQQKKTVTFIDYGDQSDGVNHDTETPFPFYPIPSEPETQGGWIESGPPGNVDLRDEDRHMLIVDTTNNDLYELYNVFFNGTNWEAASGAFYDMDANGRRPEGWTSADAAGLAILPGLVRYDEVNGPDEIRHAFRMTVDFTNGYVFPASHDATTSANANAVPLGARLRLKASKDISTFAPDMQKIFRAMKKYGLIVADNGSDMYVSGAYDVRWDNDVLNPAFGALKASDFEVIERGWAPSVSLVLDVPAAVGAGDTVSATLTARNASDAVVTGYTGTVHFSSTDGGATLPGNYTFTGADAGTHTFANAITFSTPGSQVVTVTDTGNATITGSRGVTVGPATPTGVVATATGATQVSVSWNASAGASQYEVRRRSSVGGFTTITTTASLSFNDTTVAAGAAYVYAVRAIDASSRTSQDSARDAATTFAFTDDPLVADATIVKGAHVTQLRSAVNALRGVAGLSAFSFTDLSLTSATPVRALHVTQLRTALSQACSALALSAPSFTGTVVAGTVVDAMDVQEIRDALK